MEEAHLERVSNEERINLMRVMVPELFDQPGTILYVGAHKGGFSMSRPLYEAGNEITVLDAWEASLTELRKHSCNKRVSHFVMGDVRDLWAVTLEPEYDYSLWLHGPEHIEFHELPATIEGLEAITTRTVILACPWGRAPHGYKENPYNKHLAFLEPNDFYRLGYRVAALSPINRLGGHVLAWKRIQE